MLSDFEQITLDSLVSVPLAARGSCMGMGAGAGAAEVVLKVRESVWSGRKSVILLVGSSSARDLGTPNLPEAQREEVRRAVEESHKMNQVHSDSSKNTVNV